MRPKPLIPTEAFFDIASGCNLIPLRNSRNEKNEKKTKNHINFKDEGDRSFVRCKCVFGVSLCSREPLHCCSVLFCRVANLSLASLRLVSIVVAVHKIARIGLFELFRTHRSVSENNQQQQQQQRRRQR
jgi:hypothetical protein